jgi:hypothetical protein
MTQPMRARLVQNDPASGFIVTEFPAGCDLIAAMEVRGFTFYRLHNNPRTRPQLQGQPIFSGLLGPMWDGDRVRYEDQGAYDRLSA